MKTTTYTLELLTPCFCAGANQSVAEIRAPAIRGQLRWWFRTLGGSPADERMIFGGVAGTASASSLIIRISDIKPGPTWNPPRIDPNAPDSYVWYFASASANGARWTAAGAIPPKSTFTIHLLQRRPLTPALQTQLDFAVRCFLQLGAIGLRASRGLGSFACIGQPFNPFILAEIGAKGFASEHLTAPLNSLDHLTRDIGSLLKGTRKNLQLKAARPSPFGTSLPRQSSAIYFRPVRSPADVNSYQLVIFEAPHLRVLGPASAGMPRVIGQTPSKLTRPTATTRRW